MLGFFERNQPIDFFQNRGMGNHSLHNAGRLCADTVRLDTVPGKSRHT